MKLTISLLKNLNTNPAKKQTNNLLLKNNFFRFSEDKKQQNKIFGFIKSAWDKTFPDEQAEVKNKYKKVKQQKRFSKQQIESMQSQIPQYSRTALTQTKQVAKQQKSKFSFSKLIPQSVKNKVKQSSSYKEMSQFKENLKQYVSTRDGAVANVASMAYGVVSNPSPLAKATDLMRKYDPNFSIFQLQKQSTVIFKDTYNAFLSQNLQMLQMMANQQALQYFKAHIKLNKTKKQKPKYTELVFHYPARLKKANTGDKTLPVFQLDIKIMQIYCMVNDEGVVVDGDLQRVNQSIFQFSLGYNGKHLDQLGHPWEIVQMKKIQQMKLLV